MSTATDAVRVVRRCSGRVRVHAPGWTGHRVSQWRKLGVDQALGRVLGPRRFTTDVERVAVRAAGTITQTTELSDTQRELFAATNVQPPPRITALQPA